MDLKKKYLYSRPNTGSFVCGRVMEYLKYGGGVAEWRMASLRPSGGYF